MNGTPAGTHRVGMWRAEGAGGIGGFIWLSTWMKCATFPTKATDWRRIDKPIESAPGGGADLLLRRGKAAFRSSSQRELGVRGAGPR